MISGLAIEGRCEIRSALWKKLVAPVNGQYKILLQFYPPELAFHCTRQHTGEQRGYIALPGCGAVQLARC